MPIRELDSFIVDEKSALFDKLYGMSREYFEGVLADGFGPKDMAHYIYEAAFAGCLGKDVWTVFNKARR
jgi:hypothetical protein